MKLSDDTLQLAIDTLRDLCDKRFSSRVRMDAACMLVEKAKHDDMIANALVETEDFDA